MHFSKNLITKVAAATSLAAASFAATSVAQAAGFQLTEMSVTGLGRSHAGAGIVGDDVSAIHFNAAGMTLLQGTQMSVASTVVDLDIDYHGNDGSRENGRDKPTPVPAMFISHQLNEQLWVGLGITSPYGMKVRYGSDWTGREHGISASIITVDINPNIAWKANEMFSFGAGVSAMYTYSKIKTGLPARKVGVRTGEFEFKGSDWMWTYNLGMMFTPIETVRFGLSYRSAAHVRAKGDYTASGLKGDAAYYNKTVDGVGTLTTPETVYFSGTWEATKDLRLSSLVRWSNWKNFDNMIFTANDVSPLTGMGALSNVTIPNNWKAAWLFSLGADYKLNDQWTIRGGVGLETSPIRDAETRTALIPDTKRLWLSCGFSYQPTKNWQVDVAYGHLRGIGERKLYDNGAEVGKFERMNAWLMGAALTYRF